VVVWWLLGGCRVVAGWMQALLLGGCWGVAGWMQGCCWVIVGGKLGEHKLVAR